MPCPFNGRKMFCVGPNFLSQPQNLTVFSESKKTFVPAQKPNHLGSKGKNSKLLLRSAIHEFFSFSSFVCFDF